MKFKFLVLISLLSFSFQYVNSQQLEDIADNSATNYLDKKYNLHSEILNEERYFRVYIPFDYDETQKSYDVLYLLDGPRHFTYISGIVEYLSRYIENIPPFIIVDIEQQHRSRDMTPTNPEGSDTGGADKFSEFLSKELLPHINANFRTTNKNAVFGYSLSGLFAMYCFFEKPDIFDSYITCSPSLWWDDNLLIEKAEKFFSNNQELDKTLFVCIAEGDRQIVHDCHNQLLQIIQKSKPNKFKWEMPVIPNENHATITMTGFYFGLNSICK